MPYIQRKITQRYCQTCDQPFPIKYRHIWNCESCIAQLNVNRKKYERRILKEKLVKTVSFLVFPIGILIYFSSRKRNPELATMAINKVFLVLFLIGAIYLAINQT